MVVMKWQRNFPNLDDKFMLFVDFFTSEIFITYIKASDNMYSYHLSNISHLKVLKPSSNFDDPMTPIQGVIF